MGICASSRITRGYGGEAAAGGRRLEWRPTAKVVHVGASWAREYAAGVVAKAGQVEAENPGYYLFNSEAMHVGQRPPRVAESEDLQPGQIYFLLPLTSLSKPLALSDLCELAVIASAALSRLPPPAAAATSGFRRVKRPAKA